jgi:ABC-type protease/lipase transport system fused ATPase/permease subunit
MAAGPGVRRSELGDALRACRTAFIGVGLMSCMINLLYLTGSIFMLEVYDRVLPSRSVPTLVGLIILASFLYMAQGVLDMIRNRILGRIGTALDEALNKRVFDTIVRWSAAATKASSRYATSTMSAPFSAEWARAHSSTCPGCRSISPSASPSTS